MSIVPARGKVYRECAVPVPGGPSAGRALRLLVAVNATAGAEIAVLYGCLLLYAL